MAVNFQQKPVTPHAQEHSSDKDVVAVALAFFSESAF